jgi:DNA polymerase-3 subunit delta
VAWKPDKRLKKLWEALDANAQVIEFNKQDQRDLIAWVTRHFAARQKRISPELCAYLIDITGGTMTALAGEIAKIAAYSGAEVICRADIDAVTEPVMDAVVFQMTELLSQGKYGQGDVRKAESICWREEAVDAAALCRQRLHGTADVYGHDGDRGAQSALRQGSGSKRGR